MNEFWLWFNTGTEHILDINGYDHIIYIIALCAQFYFTDWKKLILIVTAFTIGHSITLAFSVLNLIVIKQIYVEVLIPLTIIITCLINILNRNSSRINKNQSNFYSNYFLALFFGFIHGMGFSYLLKSMLGKEESILFPLFSFNLGIEFAQIIIVFFMVVLSLILSKFTRIKKDDFKFFISSAIFGISFLLFVQRLIDLLND
jgi:hypothetical protein